MIDKLVTGLRECGIDLDWRDLCDVLWLARARGRDITSPTADTAEHQDSPTRNTVPDAESWPSTPPNAAAAQASTSPPALRRGGEAAGMALNPRVPAHHALPDQLGIARALRPLKQHRSSRHAVTFDADATADRYCDTQILVPVLSPARERWFREVALVIDGAPTMVVWRDTAHALANLLAHQGAFERVSRWTLDGARLLSSTGLPQDPRVLADEEARRLVLVLTDCVNSAWRDDAVWALLRAWGARLPVALVQTLPPRLWNATGLGETDVLLTSRHRGGANARLDLRPPWWWDAEHPPAQGLPVVTLDEGALHTWARMLMGGGTRVHGIVPTPPDGLPPPLPTPSDPRQLVSAYRSTVSPQASRLAVLLSAVEVTLPVAQLVLDALIAGARQTHIAELLAGGLLEMTSPPNPDPVYDFVPGVREVLQESITTTATINVWRTVAPYLEATTGVRTPFSVLLSSPPGTTTQAAETPLHRITATLIERLGLTALPPAGSPLERPLLVDVEGSAVSTRSHDHGPSVPSTISTLPDERSQSADDLHSPDPPLQHAPHPKRSATAADPTATTPEPAGNYLTIECKPDSLEADHYWFTAWLQVEGSPGITLHSDDIAQPLNQLAALLEQLLINSVPVTRRPTPDLTIEFILPRSLLNYPVDQIEINVAGLQYRIGIRYPVIVRSLDRMRLAAIHPDWKRKWSSLQDEPFEASVLLVEHPGAYDKEELFSRLSAASAAVLALPFPPSSSRSTPGWADEPDEHWIGLVAGVPVIAWCRDRRDPVAFFNDIKNLLPGDMMTLPRRTMALRRQALQQNSTETHPNPLGLHVTLLFDTPDRVPEPYALLRPPN